MVKQYLLKRKYIISLLLDQYLLIFSEKILTNPPKYIPGNCGLQSIGNTCYMNSILQSISHPKDFVEYFISGKYADSLVSNKEKLSIIFGSLLKGLWSDNFKFIPPLKMKQVIDPQSKYFGGTDQQDSHEFLMFLLDSLHEDLHKMTNQLLLQNLDGDGSNDKEISQLMWEKHKSRNDSIVVDLFHGLLRSKLTCSECQKTVVSFEPFNSLSISLPAAKIISLNFIFISANP
jgi:ubiquitin C-terminal hydrolase